MPDPATRPRESAAAYEEIWQEDGSPLIITSRKQQEALAHKLDIPVELGMRYGNPSTPDALKRLLDQGVDDLFIIPMYPHYAMSSYETAVVALMNAVSEQKPDIKTTLLPPFYQDPRYIDAMIDRAQSSIQGHDFDKLVFSFHGIPQRHLVKGDPSHNHCLKHTRLLQHLSSCACHLLPSPVCHDSGKSVAAANLPKDKYDHLPEPSRTRTLAQPSY